VPAAYTCDFKMYPINWTLRIGTELFMRVTSSRKTAEKHIKRLEKHNPETGVIRVIRMTEKQYDNIWYLTGGPDLQEAVVGKKRTYPNLIRLSYSWKKTNCGERINP